MYQARALWDSELSDDVDREYLLDGVLHGFQIVDVANCSPVNICCSNYKSTAKNADKVEAQILHELDRGNYVVCDVKPCVVSALGAIPKPESEKIRLIHDLTRGGVNQWATDTSVKYPTIDEAVSKLPSNCYIAKLDLSEAYRSVSVHPSCYRLTGLQWMFKGRAVTSFMNDKKLPFGAAKSCSIFQRLTNSVVRMMLKRGFTCIGYLDDYLIIGDTKARCLEGYKCLSVLLEDLGFRINWGKARPPPRRPSLF